MSTDRYMSFSEDGTEDSLEIASSDELDTLARIREQFGDKILATHTAHGDATAVVATEALLEVMTWLRDVENFVMCASLTAYDDLGSDPRFYVVYHLLDITHPERLRIKVGLPEKKA